MKVKEMALVGVFTAMLAIGAFIQLPISIVPVTLQTLIVILSGIVLKSKLASASVLLYIMIGLVGIPIFAKGGGIGYILQPTFGYLIGFILVSYMMGKVSEKTSNFKIVFVAAVISMLVIYGVGLIYFMVIQNGVYGISYELSWIFYYLFLVYLPGDLISCFIAVLIGKRLTNVKE